MRWLPSLLLGAAVLAAVLWWSRQQPVLVTVWRPSAPGFVHPELEPGTPLAAYLQARDDFGVALAGGGARGSAMGHGVVRALREAGLLQRARYLSTTSGSVWMGLQLYYQNLDSLDEYLGASLLPEQMTPEALTDSAAGTAFSRLTFFPRYPKGMNGTLGATAGEDRREAAADDAARRREAEASWGLPAGVLDRLLACWQDLCSCAVEHLIPDGSLHGLWPIASGYAFMHPFGLTAPSSSHCHETEQEAVRSRLGRRTKLYVATDMSRGLPYHVLQSAIIAPYSGRKGDPLVAFPIEHTALYTGTAPSIVGERAKPYSDLGDVLVSSYAWPGEVAGAVPSASKGSARVRRDSTLVNVGQLGQVAGLATAYIADFQVRGWADNLTKCEISAFEKILPQATLWSPLTLDSDDTPINTPTSVGDAGVYDDLGHIPLLRRRVSKLLMVDSSSVHDNSSGRDDVDLCQMVYTLAAFGQPGCLQPPNPPGSPSTKMRPGTMTVFEPSEFAGFWQQIKARRAANEPAVIRGRYTVVDNPLFDIKGGWQVDIVWVIGMPSTAFRSRLPARTAAALSDFFPNYYAAEVKNRFLFSAISQYGSWLFKDQVLKEVRQMLDGPLEQVVV